MEDPVAEIPNVIHALTQTSPSVQLATIRKYFAANASFTHPLCRTGSFQGSRWLIESIYRWYKIMSPRIDIEVDSVAYDAKNLLLYVSVHQVFRIAVIPFYSAPVRLTTVLKLTPAYSTSSADPSFPKTKYLIQSQEDLYQSDQVILFGSMLRIVWAFVILCQFMASLLCVLGAIVGAPVSWLEENYKTTWRRLGEKTTSGMIVREEQEKDTERTRRRELDEGPPKVEEVL